MHSATESIQRKRPPLQPNTDQLCPERDLIHPESKSIRRKRNPIRANTNTVRPKRGSIHTNTNLLRLDREQIRPDTDLIQSATNPIRPKRNLIHANSDQVQRTRNMVRPATNMDQPVTNMVDQNTKVVQPATEQISAENLTAVPIPKDNKGSLSARPDPPSCRAMNRPMSSRAGGEGSPSSWRLIAVRPTGQSSSGSDLPRYARDDRLPGTRGANVALATLAEAGL
jgi:hypothetical protein